jgi:hypothetical protein
MANMLQRWLAIGTFAAALPLASVASAQYTHDPFFERMLVQSQAFGLEMIGLRLSVVEHFETSPDDDFMELVEKILGRDYGRFAGTLESRNPTLAADLRAILEEIEETLEEGGNAAALVPPARELLAEAYDVVIEANIRAMPSFIGTVLADLLLADDGVAEAYEDAMEGEPWEYPNGWAALQRVKVLWAEVADMATDERREDVEEMIGFLDELYPSPDPANLPAAGDPEEAEAPAHRIVGILEEVVDAQLYSGRDLALLAGHLADVLAPACEAYAAGEDAVAVEGVYAVRDHYRKQLRRLLDLIAPEIHERATVHLDGLISATPPADRAAACVELQETLREARTTLGG